MIDKSQFTPEQQAALDAYWAAKSPNEERSAHEAMMALGLPDGYAPEPPSPYFYDIVVDEFRKVTQADFDGMMETIQRYAKLIDLLRSVVTPEGLKALECMKSAF